MYIGSGFDKIRSCIWEINNALLDFQDKLFDLKEELSNLLTGMRLRKKD